MMMKMKILFLCCALFFAGSVNAGYNAVYQTYGAGMNLLSAHMAVSISDTIYKITTSSETKGILSLFLDARNVFDTAGRINKGSYTDIVYSMTGLDDGQVEKTTVLFNDKPGFIDYQTTMLWLMQLVSPATQVMSVSDGKRDIEMTWVYEGKKLVPTRKTCLYQGKADVYALKLRITGGKRSGWFFKKIQESVISPFRLYFAPVDEFDSVLVFSTFDTGVVGTLDICLEEIKHETNS